MAKIVAEKHVTATANGRFGNQGIKPAELLLVGLLINIEHEVLISAAQLAQSYSGYI